MIRILFFSLLFLFSGNEGFCAKKAPPPLQTPAKKTICLNMIVKNESPVICHCLASVKKFIDYWVIVDTGSTDGTQEIIKEFMKDIPGKLYERPWKNFEHNRNEALDLAKGHGDYLLLVDADEVLVIPEGYQLPELEVNSYLATIRCAGEKDVQYQRIILIDHQLDWRWKGVLHEQLVYPKDTTCRLLSDMYISAASTEGYRTRDPDKYIKDARVLEEALKTEPNNAEYVYYLAQSYFNAKDYEKALKYYAKRIDMGGWDQVVYLSKYYLGVCQGKLGMEEDAIKSYCEAYHYRQNRGEPLYSLADHFYREKEYLIVYALAKYGMTLSPPQEVVYVEKWMYEYGFLFFMANAAVMLGKYEEAIEAYEKLLLIPSLSESGKAEIKSNLAQTKAQLFLKRHR